MLIDLHIHTQYSDGSQTPEQVAAEAVHQKLPVISVTDHNTTAAYDRLEVVCQKLNLRLVRGMELDVAWRDRALHLLGYAFDRRDPGIVAMLRRTFEEYTRFDEDLIANLSRNYPQLSVAGFRAYRDDHSQGGWKNTNYLKAMGVVENVADGIKFFATHSTYEIQYPRLAEACALISQAGGVPVLAHPGNWWDEHTEGLLDIFSELQRQGVAGIECVYPSHSPAMTKLCLDFCRGHDLRTTAGGDGHGVFNRVVNGVTYDIGVVRGDTEELDLRGIL